VCTKFLILAIDVVLLFFLSSSSFSGGSVPYRVSECREAMNGTWFEINPFLYADRSTSPPALLRDPGDQNYLSPGVRAVGLAMMSIALLTVTACFVWIIVYRNHAVVKASQPNFLLFFCAGSAITSLTILPASFDESHGLSEAALTVACISKPWLATMGHMVTYYALYAKLWRVHKVLQFTRRKVNVRQVVWPGLLLAMMAFAILYAWTATTDYGWKREEIDGGPDSIGKCTAGEMPVAPFLIPLLVLVLIPTVLTEFMAYKTTDVDAAFSESKWIFGLTLLQFQVILVGVPLMVILDDVSSDGGFIGLFLVIFSFPMSACGLIMIPKIVAVHMPSEERPSQRGATGGRVQVSGIPSSQGMDNSYNRRASNHSNRRASFTENLQGSFTHLKLDTVTEPQQNVSADVESPISSKSFSS